MPPAAMMPAWTPPNTDVMPARYAVDTRVRPRSAAKLSQVMMPWRYASRQPAMPAMNDAIAKLSTFTNTTLTPMPAAERSLARTASIAEPSELLRKQGHARRDDDADDQAHEPERQAWEVLAGTDAEVDAEDLGLPDGVAEGLDEVGVAEPDRFDAERQREGDDAERQPPQPQGGEPDEHAHDGRRRRREQRRDRERHAPVDRQVAQHERRRRRRGRAARATPGPRTR